MWNEDEIELKVILWIKFIYYNIQVKKVVGYFDDLMKLFQFVVLLVNQLVFENRCLEIIQELKSWIYV